MMNLVTKERAIEIFKVWNSEGRLIMPAIDKKDGNFVVVGYMEDDSKHSQSFHVPESVLKDLVGDYSTNKELKAKLLNIK